VTEDMSSCLRHESALMGPEKEQSRASRVWYTIGKNSEFCLIKPCSLSRCLMTGGGVDCTRSIVHGPCWVRHHRGELAWVRSFRWLYGHFYSCKEASKKLPQLQVLELVDNIAILSGPKQSVEVCTVSMATDLRARLIRVVQLAMLLQHVQAQV